MQVNTESVIKVITWRNSSCFTCISLVEHVNCNSHVRNFDGNSSLVRNEICNFGYIHVYIRKYPIGECLVTLIWASPKIMHYYNCQ